MLDTLSNLRQKVVIGFVGGSDLSKQLEQLGPKGNSVAYIKAILSKCPPLVLDNFDYCFAENGLTAYRLGEQMKSQVYIHDMVLAHSSTCRSLTRMRL